MIVGFKITDFKGHEAEAVAFIIRMCILSDISIAQNIVNAGVGVNVYSKIVTQEDLDTQSFTATLLETVDNKRMLVSNVDFVLELLYNNGIIRLWPTEFIYINESEVAQFRQVYEQGLVKFLPRI